MSSVRKALEEIHLLKCSLLPGETLSFTGSAATWEALLEAYAADPDAVSEHHARVQCAPQFRVQTDVSDIWFDITLSVEGGGGSVPSVDVKGPNLGRAEQERWQAVVAEALQEVRDSEYPLYELISTHLLPRLHTIASQADAAPTPLREHPRAHKAPPSQRYHALFTSHHLKSPQKRRSLLRWAHELSLTGFAKVGYPGVIYCEGAQEDVEDFVSRVKGMQWLALRLRFIEPAPLTGSGTRGQWVEFEKVGEVVDEMRRLGRESFVVEMGIGSAGVP